eukprot:4547214-Pyramimonas_sp.AAC.1
MTPWHRLPTRGRRRWRRSSLSTATWTSSRRCAIGQNAPSPRARLADSVHACALRVGRGSPHGPPCTAAQALSNDIGRRQLRMRSAASPLVGGGFGCAALPRHWSAVASDAQRCLAIGRRLLRMRSAASPLVGGGFGCAALPRHWSAMASDVQRCLAIGRRRL